MLSGFIVSVCKWCRCSRSRSCPGLRGVSARWCASSSQAPYRSLSHQCESSFALLRLLSPKSLVTFRGPHYRALCPDHIQSDGYSVFKVHCVRGRCFQAQWVRQKSPLTMFGQRGAKKEVILRNFFCFFALLCRKSGGFNEDLHLLSHGKGRLWGCLGKLFCFCVHPTLHRPMWLQSYIHRRVENRSWDGTLRNRKVRFHAGLRDRRFYAFRTESGEKH